jgi:two-component system NtrC family response regulator
MLDYSWPGNVRQLKNVVERLVIMTDQTVVDSGSLFNHFENHRNQGKDPVPSTLEELKSVKRHLLEKQFARIEKSFLQKALEAENGNITRASERVGMQRSNFSALMKKHKIFADAGEK